MNNLKSKLLTGVLTATTMFAGASYAAETANQQIQKNTPHYTKEDVKEGYKEAKEAKEATVDTVDNMQEKTADTWEATKEKTSEAWDTTKEKASNAWDSTKEMTSDAVAATKDGTQNMYNKVSQMVKSESDAVKNVPYAIIHESQTTDYLLGKDVYDTSNKKVATVHDIIINNEGEVQSFILASSGMFGLNEKYVSVKGEQLNLVNGFVGLLVGQEGYKNFTTFDYENKNHKADHTLMSNELSLAELADADVLDVSGNEVAEVESFIINDGEVQNVIARFGTTFGMGGHKTIIPLNKGMLKSTDESESIKMNATLSEEFKDMKHLLKNS